MIRFLHLADIHLGMENYGRIDPTTGLHTRLLDFLGALDQAVDYAIAERLDLVVFAGDAYKTRDPTPTQQREFAKRLRRLREAGIPVFLLVGNHDLPNALGRAHTMEIFDTLALEGIRVARRIETHTITTANGPVQIVALPWVTRSLILSKEEFKGRNLDELNQIMLEKIGHALEDEIAGLDPQIPAILAAHGTVFGATYGSERSVMLGQDIVLPRSQIRNPAFCYVALGHIHKRQVLNDDPPVVYTGSLERLDFGEAEEEKSFTVVRVEACDSTMPGHPAFRATYQFVPVTARQFVTLRVSLKPGDDPTAVTLQAINRAGVEGAVVRLIVSSPTDFSLREDEIRRALAGVYHLAGIQRDVARSDRIRLGAAAGIEGMTPRQLLATYLQTKGVNESRIETLLKYADQMMTEMGDREIGD